MLVHFILNAGILLIAFYAASGIVGTFRTFHCKVVHWHMATTALLERYTYRKMTHCGIDSVDNFDVSAYTARQRQVAALDSQIAALNAVEKAQRGFLLYLTATIENGAGIRFLNVFKPGAASIGGLLAVTASAVALGVRLAATVYGATVV
jgi:hypothetical protein